MLLLRWRSGSVVGGILGGLVADMMLFGTTYMAWQRDIDYSPYSPGFLSLCILTGLCVCAGAAVVWVIWTALAHLFLPPRTAAALLDWQRSLATPRVSGLA